MRTPRLLLYISAKEVASATLQDIANPEIRSIINQMIDVELRNFLSYRHADHPCQLLRIACRGSRRQVDIDAFDTNAATGTH